MKQMTLRAIVLATVLASALLVAIPVAVDATPASAAACISDNDNGVWCDGEDDKDGLDDSSCCPIPGFEFDAEGRPDYSNVIGTVYYQGVLWQKPAPAAPVATTTTQASVSPVTETESTEIVPAAAELPASFDAPRVTAAHTTITVEWSAPAGSSAGQLYTVALTGAAEEVIDVNTLSHTFENLAPGEYVVQVSAETESGETFLSELSDPVVLDGTSPVTASAELAVFPTASTSSADSSALGTVTLGGLVVLGAGALAVHHLTRSRRASTSLRVAAP